MRVISLFVFASLFSFGAMAQQDAPPASTKAKDQHINFTGAHLFCEVKGPRWKIVKTQKRRSFRNLIQLRSEFAPELHVSQGAL